MNLPRGEFSLIFCISCPSESHYALALIASNWIILHCNPLMLHATDSRINLAALSFDSASRQLSDRNRHTNWCTSDATEQTLWSLSNASRLANAYFRISYFRFFPLVQLNSFRRSFFHDVLTENFHDGVSVLKFAHKSLGARLLDAISDSGHSNGF